MKFKVIKTEFGGNHLFLKAFAELLNMKIIIMSATLPDLDILSGNVDYTVRLMKNREKYFHMRVLKNRVTISYELLDSEDIKADLIEHILKKLLKRKESW